MLDLAGPAANRQLALERTIKQWYVQGARKRLAQRVERWSGIAGWAPTGVLVRDQRRRWASCSASGVLRFNWRVLMAPPALIDYVVLHELVHLRIRLHSPAFWSEVARLMPDYRARRASLKELGAWLAL